MSKFDLTHFYQFCNSLRIDTKERGQILLGKHLMGSQRRCVNEIAEGLERGIHEFVTLKARQLGISTVSLAFDLYWEGKYNGISGALITQDEPARDKFRSILEMYHQGLPPKYKRRVKGGGFGNRNQVIFQNRSRLEYRVAGTKEKKTATLGRSSALSFLHATEVAFWGNADDIDSLEPTLAQENPDRFYHWETTANGFNHFWDMWHTAKDSVTKKAIFIGWWTNEFYRARSNTDVFANYWGASGRLSRDERTMVKEVRSLYQFEIDEEQMAWYRWYMHEKCSDNELTMWQEMPGTEYQAFVASGSQYFTGTAIGNAYRRIADQEKPKCCRFQMGATFSDTTIAAVSPKIAQLRVWQEPVQGAHYCLGADPAYGSSDSADRYVLSVWRCYADAAEQVAEFCTPDLTTGAFAWAMVYLAGWYTPCVWNLEVNGPGQAVLAELQNLGRERAIGPKDRRPILEDALKSVSNYLFQRWDSLYRVPTAIHTISTYQYKERYLGTYKDYFERGLLLVRSRDLIDEMKSLKRVDGSAPEASGRNKDDRVIAGALAIIAWNDQLRSKLMMMNETIAAVEKRKAQPISNQPGSHLVAKLFQDIGFTESIHKPTLPGVSGGIAKRG